jgi:hypothetical protein
LHAIASLFTHPTECRSGDIRRIGAAIESPTTSVSIAGRDTFPVAPQTGRLQ